MGCVYVSHYTLKNMPQGVLVHSKVHTCVYTSVEAEFLKRYGGTHIRPILNGVNHQKLPKNHAFFDSKKMV